MKKYFMIGLIMALSAPNMCPAYSYRVQQLIAEKQAKMKKLESCKGTTKNLKIAGLSTLGVTAVGIGANVAEAVLLNKEKKNLNTANENLELAKQKYEAVKEAQYRKNQEQKLEYERDIDSRTCNATLDSVAGRDPALAAAKQYLADNSTDPKCKLPGSVLSGCDDKVERNGGYATLSCVMDFIHDGDTVSKTHYYNFKYKIGTDTGAPFNEEVTGCDNAITRAMTEDPEITGSCSCNGDVVTCQKNPFVDKTFKFDKITPTGKDLEANAEPTEIAEFQDKVGLYNKDVEQAKRLLKWWNKEDTANVQTETCGIDQAKKNTIKCGNVTVPFTDINMFQFTSVYKFGKYFCEKFGGSWSGTQVANNEKNYKCSNRDEYVKSCINYVFGNSIYSETGHTSECKTTAQIEAAEQQAQAKEEAASQKAIAEKELAEAAAEQAEAETKAKYCGYINCDVSVCTFGENTAQSNLYSVMCNNDSNTLKCYSKDDSGKTEYNCTTGEAVVAEQAAPAKTNRTDDVAEKLNVIKQQMDAWQGDCEKAKDELAARISSSGIIAACGDMQSDGKVHCIANSESYEFTFSSCTKEETEPEPEYLPQDENVAGVWTADKAKNFATKQYATIYDCDWENLSDARNYTVCNSTATKSGVQTITFGKIVDTEKFNNESPTEENAKKMVLEYAGCDNVRIDTIRRQAVCTFDDNGNAPQVLYFGFLYIS